VQVLHDHLAVSVKAVGDQKVTDENCHRMLAAWVLGQEPAKM
jgi:hypothetical protein